MSPANVLIIFIFVILFLFFMFIVIIACGKNPNDCEPTAPYSDNSSGGNSGSSSGGSIQYSAETQNSDANQSTDNNNESTNSVNEQSNQSQDSNQSNDQKNDSNKSTNDDSTNKDSTNNDSSNNDSTSNSNNASDISTRDETNVVCSDTRDGSKECGHNQTSNISDPIKIPQKFLDFLHEVVRQFAFRGDLSQSSWESVISSKNNRTKSINNLDIKIGKYYNSIDITKGDDFMPTTAYDKAPWYKDSQGLTNMLVVIQTQLYRAYVSRESIYFQSEELKNILDYATSQIMSHFSSYVDEIPWGDPVNWQAFGVSVPQYLLIWLVTRNCKINPGKDENQIDTPEFQKTLKGVDKYDRLAIDIFNKFYEYPDEDDCNTPPKDDRSDCWIVAVATARPTTETFQLALPWAIGRILTTMYTQTLLLDDLLVSFKITQADKNNKSVEPDLVINLIKPLASLQFETKLTLKRYDTLYGNLLYQDGTSQYRYYRIDFEIINDLRLSTQILNQLLFEGEVASAKENFYRKCIFSKIETPFLQIHPHQYFPFAKTRTSNFSNQGKYGAFTMNICSLISMKQRSWSLVYRGQRYMFYSIVHNNDLSFEDADIYIYSKEIFDKNTSENVEQRAFPYKPGVIRSEQQKDTVMAVRYTGNEHTLYSDNADAMTVHLNDNVNHSAVALATIFNINAQDTYFLPLNNPVLDKNPGAKKCRWLYIPTEVVLVTNNGMHCCLILNDYQDEPDPDKRSKNFWIGLGHTYNTGIKTQTVKTIQNGRSYQLGNNFIYLNSGFLSAELTAFKDINNINQYGLRGKIALKTLVSYSIMHTKTDEEVNSIPNELLTKPSMSATYDDNLTSNNLGTLKARIETFDFILTAANNRLYLYDRLSQTLKIGTLSTFNDKPIPARVLINRGELRKLIGDERIYKYKVRAQTDAQAYYNYDDEGDRENAKNKNTASYDKNNASPEDASVNYQIIVRDKEAFPNKTIDQLSCNELLQEYDRFSFEVRIDNVTEFN